MEILVALEEGHLPGQILPVTSMVKRAISKKLAVGERKLSLGVIRVTQNDSGK